jgi:hypothetical protein
VISLIIGMRSAAGEPWIRTAAIAGRAARALERTAGHYCGSPLPPATRRLRGAEALS